MDWEKVVCYHNHMKCRDSYRMESNDKKGREKYEKKNEIFYGIRVVSLHVSFHGRMRWKR